MLLPRSLRPITSLEKWGVAGVPSNRTAASSASRNIDLSLRAHGIGLRNRGDRRSAAMLGDAPPEHRRSVGGAISVSNGRAHRLHRQARLIQIQLELLRQLYHNVLGSTETEIDLKVGYGRTSTLEQQAGLDAQYRDLTAAGCEKIFHEQVSAVGKRPQLEAALDFIREHDTLIVTKLDRLARSTQHLLEIAERVKGKGADLSILNLGADTSTATGKLMFTIIGAIGCFERELMLERQREGVARAKAEGKYKGRKPTARAKSAEIKSLKSDGVRPVEIARRLGIGRASVYRALAAEAQR
jgi:DNA invertase Pin-like site-specific DNA recombinase